ncbi:YciI family protein [Pseudomonas sp. LB3P14]
MSQDLSRRRFLASAAGVACLALTDMPSVMAASSLPTLSGVLSGNPVQMKIVNYAMYVQDRARVDASRAEHQTYADRLREHDRLVMGGPLLDDDGRPSGVLLVYDVESKQQAEMLAQHDPFALKGAIANYRLTEWTVLDSNIELLTASLVPANRRAPSNVPRAPDPIPVAPDEHTARLYVNYTKYVSDRSHVEQVMPAHQSYTQALKANGELIMAGPFADGSGALFIYQAQSTDKAMALALKDPYHVEGVFETFALAEWRLFGLNAGLIQSV